jgi:pyruvate dehydrogenase E1 component
MLHPDNEPRTAFVTERLADTQGVIVAASDCVKAMPDGVAKWMPRDLYSLGTDGFGRSEDRVSLRDFFEVDARWITLATLSALAREGKIDRANVVEAMQKLSIDADTPNPLYV